MVFGNSNVKCKTSCKGKDLLILFMLMTVLKNILSWECKFPPGAYPEKNTASYIFWNSES